LQERKKKKGRQPERGVMFGCQEPRKREIRSPKGSTHTQELEREREIGREGKKTLPRDASKERTGWLLCILMYETLSHAAPCFLGERFKMYIRHRETLRHI
jgi:hypothetical protein